MYRSLRFALGLMLWSLLSLTAQALAGVVEGTVKKIDSATKTVVVKTADGTDHTFHIGDHTAVYGAEAGVKGTKATLHGLKEGSKVAVHYTGSAAKNTADEIDYIGKNGLKSGEGTIKKIDRDAKTLTVKSVDGTEETFRLSERAAKDAGKDIGKGSEKSEKVTVYYTEQAGHKIAHLVKKVF
jgi:Cu/Ag efflux protein CusF